MMSSLYVSLQPFFRWLIQTSIVCSVLVGLIILLKLIFRNKLPARWHYLLWLTLIFRLILPPLPENLFHFQDVLPEKAFNVTVFHSIEPQRESHNMTPPTIKDNKSKKDISKTNTDIEPGHQSMPVGLILMIFWSIGVLSLTIMTVFSNLQLSTYVKRQSHITEADVIQLFDLCKSRMSIKRQIPVLVSKKLISPTLLGVIRPKILLSQDHINMLNENQLIFVFYHELSHMKRKDIAVNGVMNVLLILHWFNPILWYAFYRMRQDQEIGCDALALSYLDEGQKLEYGHTIIKLLDSFTNHSPISSFANMTGSKRSLKRRILMIKQFHKKSYRWSLLGVVSIIALAGFSFVNTDAASNNVIKKDGLKKISNTSNKLGIAYTPPKHEENYKDFTKEEILTKMINSVDYFETAKGEFTIHYGNIDSADGYTLIDYELSLKNKVGGFSKEARWENGKDKVTETYYNDKSLWYIDEEEKSFRKVGTGNPNNSGTLTLDNAFQYDNEGNYVTYYRERPLIGQAMSALFPYEIASNYTRDLTKWEIEKQNEMLLGHNTLLIKGVLNDFAANKSKSKTFHFWVDKDTGILVKYETYNSAGTVVDYLYPAKLEVNISIDSKNFTPNLDGYTEYNNGMIKLTDIQTTKTN